MKYELDAPKNGKSLTMCFQCSFMKSIIEAIRVRRSIRSYTGELLEEWQVKNLIRSFFYAPSAMNWRPCHLVTVRNRKTLMKLSKVTPWAKMLERAGVGFVIVGDEEKSQWWVEDCSIACEHLWLEAADMNLGACWVQVREVENAEGQIKELLEIPGKFRVLSMMAVGMPKKFKPPHNDSAMEKERLHIEKF